jgi:hypothetical protein
MAIRDYLEDKGKVTEDFKGIPFKLPQTASVSLASVDSDMEQAQKAAQNRGRREAIQKQIDNLENHNKELRTSLENLRKNTLSNMDEDKIVAMAKAKGIKNEDIDAWLNGRAQRSARDISRAQTRELEKQAEELKEQNKAQDVQAIYEADQDYAKAFEEAKYRSQDETEASMDKNVLAKKNKLDTLKSQFKRRYGVTWEDYTKQPKEKENLSVTVTEEGKEKVKGGEVVLQDEEAAVLDETTLQKFNERDTTNKEKRAIKAEAQKKVRQKSEAAKARKEELNSIKTDLAILGIKSPDDVYTNMNTFETSQYRNDKDKRDAYDRIVRFKRSDKEFNTFKKLGNLLTGK